MKTMSKTTELSNGHGQIVLAAVVSAVLVAAAMPAVAAPAAGGVEEVVVTATKRSVNVQDVAGSVSVQTGDKLLERRQEQLSDYAAYVPGFNVSNGGKAGLAAVNLRGVASVSDAASVGTYVDEIPLGSSSRYGSPANQILDLLPYDLDRLEVLRGPQGTLYGAGSMGGLIKYVLKTPSLGKNSYELGADIASLDGAGNTLMSFRGAADIGVIDDVLGFRISLYDKVTPGYIDNAATGEKDVNEQKQKGGRLAMLWKPSDDLSIKLGAVFADNEADDGGTVSYAGFTPTTTGDGSAIGTISSPYGDLTQNHAFPQGFHQRLGIYSATVNWNPGPFEVISATGFTNQRTFTSVDQTTALGGCIAAAFGLPCNINLAGSNNVKVEKFTEELRLVSPQGQQLEWMVGGFYTDEKVTLNGGALNIYLPGKVLLGPLLPPRVQNSTYREYAFFGDATWYFSDKFDVSAGLRFANNKQEVTGTSGLTPPTDESVTTWSASARYHVSADAMIYGRVGTGYRAGGTNTVVLATIVPPRVNSDSLTSYEIGLKSELLDNRMIFNATAFYIDWKDIQLNSTQNGNTILTNGGQANPKGLEASLQYMPSEGLMLGANAAYTQSELTQLTPGAFFLKGYQLPGVPEFSYSLTADYSWSMMNEWTAHVGGGLRWVDKVWLTGVQQAGRAAPAIEAPSYALLNLNASMTRGPWTLKVYGANLTNERAVQGGLELINIANQPQQADLWIVQPRSLGVGFDFRF